jgi:hypothetical protein
MSPDKKSPGQTHTPGRNPGQTAGARAFNPSASHGTAASARPDVKPPAGPAAYRPNPVPKVMQAKMACAQPQPQPPTTQVRRTPAAPPVYRPEQRKIVQPKLAAGLGGAPSARPRHTPQAPPPYRPQPIPKVLQLKSNAARAQAANSAQPHAAHASSPRARVPHVASHAGPKGLGACGCKPSAGPRGQGGCNCTSHERGASGPFGSRDGVQMRPSAHPFAGRGAGLAVQRKVKTSKEGVKYEDDEGAAKAYVIAYAKKLEEKLTDSTLTTATSVAMNPALGLDQAENIVFSQRQIRIENQQKAARRAEYEGNVTKLLELVDDDSLAATMLNLSFGAYVGGGNRNISIGGGPYSQAQADAACQDWEILKYAEEDDRSDITFWGYRCQDKAAKGGSQVGATLATRTFQANFLSSWGGVQVNVHMDLGVAACPVNCGCANA